MLSLECSQTISCTQSLVPVNFMLVYGDNSEIVISDDMNTDNRIDICNFVGERFHEKVTLFKETERESNEYVEIFHCDYQHLKEDPDEPSPPNEVVRPYVMDLEDDIRAERKRRQKEAVRRIEISIRLHDIERKIIEGEYDDELCVAI